MSEARRAMGGITFGNGLKTAVDTLRVLGFGRTVPEYQAWQCDIEGAYYGLAACRFGEAGLDFHLASGRAAIEFHRCDHIYYISINHKMCEIWAFWRVKPARMRELQTHLMVIYGWTSNKHVKYCLKKHFQPHTHEKANSEILLLIFAGYADGYCILNRISFALVPSHSSHLTYPLDINAFGSLKSHLIAELDRYILTRRPRIQKVEWLDSLAMRVANIHIKRNA